MKLFMKIFWSNFSPQITFFTTQDLCRNSAGNACSKNQNLNFALLFSASKLRAIKTDSRDFSCLFLIERQLSRTIEKHFQLFTFLSFGKVEVMQAGIAWVIGVCAVSSFFRIKRAIWSFTKRQMAANCGRRARRFWENERFVEVKNNGGNFSSFCVLLCLKWDGGMMGGEENSWVRAESLQWFGWKGFAIIRMIWDFLNESFQMFHACRHLTINLLGVV